MGPHWSGVGQLSYDSSHGLPEHIEGRQNTQDPAATGGRHAKCQALSLVGLVHGHGVATKQHMPLTILFFSWPTDHLWLVGPQHPKHG